MSRLRVWLAAAFFCALVGCSSDPARQPEIGEAYAGPASLRIRKDVDLHSAEVAVVSHGDRLGIISRRRRFVRVRTSKGVEGWTDLRMLLGTRQMDDLNRLADTAQKLPSQGAATVYEALNVHTLPNRQAPSFYRIKEGENVDVVAHELCARVPLNVKDVIIKPAPKAPKPEKKPKEEPRTPPPPMPPAPKLPENWLELSQSTLPPEEDEPAPAEPAKPVPMDDWSLVRMSNGRAGWVLSSNLKLNIPDEVAQYSEGHRITSYFATGNVNDGGQVRHHYLWTTIKEGRQPYEFDSFRYFIWNTRRHRYETAYVERNLKGFYPVEVHSVNVPGKTRVDTFPGFSVIVEEDGVRYRKTYSYQIYLVHLVSKERINTPPPAPIGSSDTQAVQAVLAQTAHPEAPQKPGLYARFKQNLSDLKSKLFGKPDKPANR